MPLLSTENSKKQVKYYQDEEKKTLKDDLLSECAEETATELVPLERDQRRDRMRPARNAVTSSQLRKFFFEFRNLEKKVHHHQEHFERVKPLIKMVKSKAMYQSAGSNQKIPETFKNFLIQHVNSIDDEKDFRAFMLHFEAVVGFCYGLGLRQD